MKRFIIISLLAALTLPALSCAWQDNHNYYLFSICSDAGYRERIQKICNDNWKAYLGATDEWYYFDAEEVVKAARQKGDALMVSYVENLQKYLKCVDVEQQKLYEWNYPTPEQLAACKRDLQAIRTYALGKTKTKLRSQHALLYMRCNMMLGRHQENVTYWEQTASQFIDTVYKEMMKNIYAGALYKTGKEAQAGEIFAEMGDSESLMTQFYKKRSYLAISQHYRQNPNSKVLPFLLQDFVNNVQEAIDLQNDTYGGKLFIRDINKEEAWQMMQFCELVVREGKTETPIMWKSAKAWMEFLYGKKKEATQDILAASSLAGTDRMKDCTRELILYITASQAKPSQTFDDYLADELAWLKGRKDGQAYRVINRLTHQALFEHYAADASRKGALMEFANCYVHDYLDTLQVEKVEQYLTYRTTPATNKLDQLLKEQEQSENFTQEMYDLIGTKYMRLCQWGKAISWLKQVPDNFYNTRGYRIYAALRSYQVEPWMKRQWLSEDVMNSSQDRRVWKHPKLNFAREVQMMEGSLHLLSGKALEQRCYNLAVRYAQANFRGDCWWLMRDAWSVTDTVRVHETNLAAKAVELLQKAAVSTDFDLKTKALFALGYCELYSKNFWREKIWDTALGDFVDRYNPQSPQFRAYKALFDLLKDEPEEASYIGNCDEFDVFRSYCRSH